MYKGFPEITNLSFTPGLMRRWGSLVNIRELSCLGLHPQSCWLQNKLTMKPIQTSSLLSLTQRISMMRGSATALNAPRNIYLSIIYQTLGPDVTTHVWDGQGESVSLSWNPNDGIGWPRLPLPWWPAPWICDRGTRESGGGGRRSWRDKHGREADSILVV